LNRGFTLLLEKKRIADKPKIKKLKENNIRTDFLEHWEYLKLLENASQHIVPIIKLAYKTGWRTEEITDLTWDMVDIDNGIITLPPGDYTKNEEGRVYYLDKELASMFRGMWSDRRVLRSKIPYVFLNRWKNGKMNSFKEAWKASCKRAGLDKKHFHGFRRTAVRNMVRAGVPERVAMTVSGHKTRSVFERYNITSLKDLQIASKKMEEYLEGQSEIKPEEMPQEKIRDWESFRIPIKEETPEAKAEQRPLKEITDEIVKEYENQKDDGEPKENNGDDKESK
jgi:integrase